MYEWEQIERQCASEDVIYLDDNETVKATASYVVNLQNYIDIVRYEEIVWVYRKSVFVYKRGVISIFIIVTRDARILKFKCNRADDREKVRRDEARIYGAICDKKTDVLTDDYDNKKKQAKALIKAWKNDSSYIKWS
ncbi:MAG: hypothetical protein FWD45_06360 [Coriobacteriia bacterium]|nr:hypothetical protein [Coriobacteriia bacterium]